MSKYEVQQPARRRLRVADLNPHLMCILCGGYYVDATTIIECLHSFCKSCLVKYLESNKYCPICEVQVHKTRPLQNIRPDETLQNMVYKLVPGLFQKEMQIRQEFYTENPDAPESSPFDRGVVDPIECQFYTPEEAVSLALEFKSHAGPSSSSNGVYKRYLRCPAAVTIAHLQKLVRNKFGLASHYDVEIMFLDKLLQSDLSIMDVAYAFQRKRKEQFHFTYRIVDTKCKRMRLDAPVFEDNTCEPMEVDPVPSTIPPAPAASHSPPESKSKLDSIISRLGIAKQTEEAIKKEKAPEEWKEVQLQISENGVMSVTDISSLDKLIDSVEKNISSVENSTNGKSSDALKTTKTKQDKKELQSVGQEKSKLSVGKSQGSAKSPPTTISNALSGGEIKKKSSLKPEDKALRQPEGEAIQPSADKAIQKPEDKAVQQTEDKAVQQEEKKEVQTKSETPPVVSIASCTSSSSSLNPVAVNSSTSNTLTGKGVATTSVATSSTSSVGVSVPSILSSSISAQMAVCAISSSSTTSVSSASTPIPSVVSISVPSGSVSSTKATPTSAPSVSAPSASASSVTTAKAPTVSVTAVTTPAVSTTSASTSTPARKPDGLSTSASSSTTVTPTSSSVKVTKTSNVTPVSVTSSTMPSTAASVSSSCTFTVSTSSAPSRASSKPVNTTPTTSATPPRVVAVSAPKQPCPAPANLPASNSKKSSSSAVGYKTLRCGPKNWNPTVSRGSLLASKMDQQQNEGGSSGSGTGSSAGKPTTQPRFFKMRNTPRYLGNPASGVKPMYQVPEPQASTAPSPSSAAAPGASLSSAPSKAPSLMKLDPRTLTPIVSNAPSSPTVKSPTSQSKGRPPFPSTTLTSSPQVNNHIASSRSVATTTTTTSSANLSSMRSSPTSAQAQAQAQVQAMANFLNPFVPKGMPNFLYGTIPSLLPAGPAQFANMLRPYPPVHPAMLFPHQIHRQLSVAPSPSSSSSPPSPSSPTVQRILASGEKSSLSPSYRSNRSSDSAKVNGQDSPKSAVAVKPKMSPRPATEPPYSPTLSKTNSSSLLSKDKDSGRVSGGSTNDNNNTVPASKVKAHLEKSDGEKLSHNISKLLPKAITKHSENQVSVESKGPGVSSFQTPH